MQNKDYVMLAALFVIALFLWTLPIQKSPLPFGEGDGAWHFANGDYIYATDHSMGIKGLPDYISFWYYGFNKMLGPGALEYPPSNHVNYAIMQIFGGERFVPVSIFKALTSFIGVFGVYFLMRKLYGFIAACLASFGMIFSLREYMIYLWGQHPSTLSFVMIPLILYAVYSYFEKKKASYLYMATLLLAAQYLLHLQGIIVSIIILIMFFIFLLIKQKLKIIKTIKKDLKHVMVCVVLFAIISLPFIMIYLGALESVGTSPNLGLGRLLQWSISPESVQGAFPPSYVLFSPTGGVQTAQYRLFFVPFILIGLIYLALKRDNKALLMLSWFVAIYITLHLDVFLNASSGRVARTLICEPPMIFSLTAIGLTSVFSFVKMPKNYRILLKYTLAIIFAILIVFTLGKQAHTYLNNAYPPINRLTSSQLEVSEWMNKNLPENAMIFDHHQGTLDYSKIRWMLAVSRRSVARYITKENIQGAYEIFSDVDVSYYFMLDYSDWVALGNQAGINALQDFESRNFAGKTPLYDQHNIKVYELESNQFVE